MKQFEIKRAQTGINIEHLKFTMWTLSQFTSYTCRSVKNPALDIFSGPTCYICIHYTIHAVLYLLLWYGAINCSIPKNNNMKNIYTRHNPTGPVVSLILLRVNHRLVAMTGGVMSGVSLIASAFITNTAVLGVCLALTGKMIGGRGVARRGLI